MMESLDNNSLTIGITTYNRRNILKMMASSFYEAEISIPYNIRIYDDASTEYDESYLKELFPNAVSIRVNHKNLGSDKNIKNMYEDFLLSSDTLFFNADSDLVFSKNCFATIIEWISYTDGVISAFNTCNHKTLNSVRINDAALDEKESLGSAGVLFKREIVEDIVKNLGFVENSFDWEWSDMLRKQGVKLFATSKSLIQHIGITGFNSNISKFDYGKGFVVDTLQNGQIINDTLYDVIADSKGGQNSSYSLFPFTEVERGKRIVIYGAGRYGQGYIRQIEAINYCEIVAVVDSSFDNMENVISPDEIANLTYDYIVIAISRVSWVNDVKAKLKQMGVPESCVITGCHKRIIRG